MNTPRSENTEYMREYRAAGRDKSAKARSKAEAAAAAWVRAEHPYVWHKILRDARLECGLPVDVAVTTFSKPINHGTIGGVSAHRYRGVPLCAPCREARKEYHRQYRARS